MITNFDEFHSDISKVFITTDNIEILECRLDDVRLMIGLLDTFCEGFDALSTSSTLCDKKTMDLHGSIINLLADNVIGKLADLCIDLEKKIKYLHDLNSSMAL